MSTQSLTLTAAQREQISNHALRGRPNEVCGVIGGWADRAQLVIPLANIAATPRTRYTVSPAEFVTAYRRIESNGGELIAIYHSHPTSAPIPSVTDIAEATWPDVVYVIVGFPNGDKSDSVPIIAAWSIRRGEVLPITLLA